MVVMDMKLSAVPGSPAPRHVCLCSTWVCRSHAPRSQGGSHGEGTGFAVYRRSRGPAQTSLVPLLATVAVLAGAVIVGLLLAARRGGEVRGPRVF